MEAAAQPPSGGCVLKLLRLFNTVGKYSQPPSGGCVLKLKHINNILQCYPTSRLRAAVC